MTQVRLFGDTNRTYEAQQCKVNATPRDGDPCPSHRSRQISLKDSKYCHRNSAKGMGKHIPQYWVKTYSIIKRISFNNYNSVLLYLLLLLQIVVVGIGGEDELVIIYYCYLVPLQCIKRLIWKLVYTETIQYCMLNFYIY